MHPLVVVLFAAGWCRDFFVGEFAAEKDAVNHDGLLQAGKGILPQSLEHFVISPSILALKHHVLEFYLVEGMQSASLNAHSRNKRGVGGCIKSVKSGYLAASS